MDNVLDIYRDDCDYMLNEIRMLLDNANIKYILSDNDKVMDNVYKEAIELLDIDPITISDNDMLDIALSINPNIDKLRFLEYIKNRLYPIGRILIFSVFGKRYRVKVEYNIFPSIFIDSGNGYIKYIDLDEVLAKIRLVIHYKDINLIDIEEVYEEVISTLKIMLENYDITYYYSADVGGFDSLYKELAQRYGTTEIYTILQGIRSSSFSEEDARKFWDYLINPYQVTDKVMLTIRTNLGYITLKHDEGVISKIYFNGKTEIFTMDKFLDYLSCILDLRYSSDVISFNVTKMTKCSEIAKIVKLSNDIFNSADTTFEYTNFGVASIVESLTSNQFIDVNEYVKCVKDAHYKTCPHIIFDRDLYLEERVRVLLGISYFKYTLHYRGKSIEISTDYINGFKCNFDISDSSDITQVLRIFYGMEEN